MINVSGGYHVAEHSHALTLGDGDFQPLRGPHDLSLSVAQRYRIIEFEGPRGPWKVTTVAYAYVLQRGRGQEVFAYHWSPAGPGRVRRPHVHLGPGAEVGFEPLSGAHLATGRIALEDVLRLAIEELAVEPLRDDWSDVLDLTQAGYEDWRTWPAPRGDG